MGGNVFAGNIRLDKDNYEELTEEVMEIFYKRTSRRIALIPSYREKASFGDADFLVEKPKLTKQEISEWFGTDQVSVNGDVVSFQYKDFQVDLIFARSEDVDISYHYFSWNDLGNLLGRIYKKMGFKFGHLGLSYIVQEGSWKYSEIVVSKNINHILAFACLDPLRFHRGFNTMEEIYWFVASSMYFNPDIYLLHNRGHAARTRDRKRLTYHNFLLWLPEQNNLPHYPWRSVDERGGYAQDAEFLKLAFGWFVGFHERYIHGMEQFRRAKEVKRKFNGDLVREWTGLTGPELGRFMQHLKKSLPDVADLSDVRVKTLVLEEYNREFLK